MELGFIYIVARGGGGGVNLCIAHLSRLEW